MKRSRTYPKRSAAFKMQLIYLFMGLLLGSAVINSCNTHVQPATAAISR